eukprot:CAMPEP_0168188090 /NCGR_PEP_ID=MMETSP0139_2-20121125/15423_1 /TAXON_ID=44445 /ORGANISM="Pseudo-nitzschia australis, Strain 10249 10 AB" /LENGTH=1330 /DNA_ID=CAMNT_0008110427 /DNA_START=98 /DNA_END=4090 /DNA_ORIENTATION=-
MTTSFGSLVQSILLLLICGASPSIAVTNHDSLVEWLRATPNGFFSEKISWQHLDPNDPTSPYAMHASEDIPRDESLIVVPQSMLITKDTGYNCDSVTMLLEELEKGKDSGYFPYVDYLFGDGTKQGNLPFEWSDLGQELLDLIIGDGLYPKQFDHHYVEQFCPNIIAEPDDPTQLEIDAYLFMISRSWDDVMIPVYDMVNHRNGKWRNVEASSAHNGEDITVFALRDIAAGEQLYISYSECDDDDCQGLKYKYLTSHILADYGFVEQYPRRFAMEEDAELVAEVDVDEATGEKFLSWPLEKHPTLDQLNFIVAQLKRLHAMDDFVSNTTSYLDSNHERGVIKDYYDAYKEVLELAVAYRDGDSSANSAANKQYDPLTEAKGLGVEGENIEVCWENPSDRDWDTSDASKSQYQEIEFTYNKERDNTCLHLSGWLQTCTNFRPHYHEAFVHVPAQYVEDVKRVAFLGGGDNMILHEILKYPNLELVVGMELDQQVIRSAFKNLGTLPYFDDHRVHWWFGDATKSLFALPESYFGSFDLVLVDLQTFVADALKVTDKLTIMDTAILLMKPDGGVIAKNEDFNVRANVGFAKYTVDLEYHNVPQICQQSITMGSNSIDFLTATPKAHDIEALTFQVPGSEDFDPFNAWYSYRQTIRDTCAATYDSSTEDASIAKSKDQIGILVILEAENVSRPLGSLTDVQAMVRAAVKKLGLTEVSISSGGDKSAFYFIMKEGYVAARVFAEKKYIAFDVLLWDNLDLNDSLDEVLIKAVGGNLKASASSFRFVSGGISGLDTYQEDVLTKVASETEALLCQDDDTGVVVTSEDSTYEITMSIILRDLVTTLIPRDKGQDSSVIGIMCNDKMNKCSSLETINDLGSPPLEVVPIYACSSFDDMQACEKEIEETLKTAVKQYKKLDALVMDVDLSFSMGQIFESIFSNKVTHNKIMERSHLILTPIVEGESWRNVLIDRFRTDIVLFDGANRADIRFSKVESGKKESYFKWSIFYAYDTDFYTSLSSALSIVKEHTSLEAEVEEVANGIVNYVADLNWEEFTDSDYDKTRSKAQWDSQTPMGHQTIFQMNVQPPKTQLDEGERVLAEYQPGPWDVQYGDAVVEKYLGDEIYSVLYDGDEEPEPIRRDQIRKFSEADIDMSKSFEVGDLIFYKNRHSIHQNGVISRIDDDGTYSIYLLNTSGQKLYGVRRKQLMYQFETADFYQQVPDLSIPILHGAFEKALKTKVLGSKEVSSIESFPMGLGVLMTAFWNDGHALLKWGGMKRVDVNFFTYEEDMDMRLAFQDVFCGEIDYMKSVARDEHPRGHGGIVNFGSEIAKPPHWINAQ